ncbi:hypothetical protein F5B18DRAFT_665753 [Nemania serpens]|nr:hypothetical protein F5B18DRAFT_665753 [Nemania serpens]
MLLNLFLLGWTSTVAALCAVLVSLAAYLIHWNNYRRTIIPVSVNYHFTRKCNKECGFCFHTEKSSHVASEDQMKHGLRLLKAAGSKPFLYPDRLATLCRFCKEELGLESVSIISNGTKIRKRWMEKHGQWVDVLGVSCDSFDEETNKAIGRGTGDNVKQLFKIRDWCREFQIKFKLNTVICIHNWEEHMANKVQELEPFRWKVFQVLYVEGENDSLEEDVRVAKRKRNAKKLLISDNQFKAFCDKHQHVVSFVPEPNTLMASSYLILDEYLCFLDKGTGAEKQSRSILDVGVQKALSERGGVYNWTKEVAEENVGGCGSASDELSW